MKSVIEIIEKVLTDLGVPADSLGFKYLCKAIELLFNNNDIRTTELYYVIADQFTTPGRKVNYAQVERVIRYSTKHMRNADSKYIDLYLNGTNNFKNGNIIALLHMYVSKEMKKDDN